MGQAKRRGNLQQRMDWAIASKDFVDRVYQYKPKEKEKLIEQFGGIRQLAEHLINDHKEKIIDASG